VADDPNLDPRAILRSIAADPTAPATARVAAARALMPEAAKKAEQPLDDPVLRKALQFAAERNRRLNLKTPMPIIEVYRGIGIHDFQDVSRISEVVKPAIDHVFNITQPHDLIDYAGNALNPPEARLFAADRYQAIYDVRAEQHGKRPAELQLLAAKTAGVDCLQWASSWQYCSLLDVASPGTMRPPCRPPEQQARIEQARAAIR
jgi:hypothetical protein